MKNDFFHIKDLNEQLQIRNVPDELFSETFLLNYEENRILLSRDMAEVFRNPGQPLKGNISLDELLNSFTTASRSVFLHDLALLKEKQKAKTDSHLDIVKDGGIANILIVMMPLEDPGYILGIGHLNFDLTYEHNLQLEETIRQLRQAESVNQLILEGSSDYIYQLDLVNNVCTFSPKAMDVLPLENNTFSNAMDRLLGFILPEDRSVFLDSFAPFLSGKSQYHKAEYRVMTKFGTVIWIRCQGKGMHDENGNPLMIAGSLVDITEQKANEEKLKDILYYDILTGLKNRNCFEKDMKKYLEDPSAAGSILCIDIHNFKIFNELFGRDFANKILIEFTRIISLYISDNLGVYRLEGDEFLVHIRENTQEQILEKLIPFQMYLSRERTLEGHVIFIRANIGVAIYPQNGTTSEELIQNANMALLMRSKTNRHQTVFFRSESMDSLNKKYILERVIRQDVTDGMKNFRLVFQPVMEISEGKALWHGAEALLRYHTPDLEGVSQEELIETLEYSDLILTAGRWVVKQAVKECKNWHKMGFPLYMNINISAQQVSDKDLVSYIRKCCRESELDPKWLVFELTETSLINNFEIADQFCRELRDMGAGAALDDFGTGYSSFTYLKRLTISQIKVDREYIQHISKDTYNQIFLKCLYDLGSSLGVKICAEGVETEETYQKMLEMGVPLMQGFYFDRPLEAEEFRQHISAL
ncbi:MAG TPA: EAL domain-containing protein [Candidatus Blautia merdigallinarum]|uniref:EAL domain-containing protein n=1 Tax=Candidatus Blautia merdigallinarum TaxID=2838495 RepID=A0A9D2N3F7_9FIRM|nr:EAL domain-containing protein [Candidatus Blautia merdigallinarum]